MKTLYKLFLITFILFFANSKIYLTETEQDHDDQIIRSFVKNIENFTDFEKVTPIYKKAKQELKNKENKVKLIKVIETWMNKLFKEENSPTLNRLMLRIR